MHTDDDIKIEESDSLSNIEDLNVNIGLCVSSVEDVGNNSTKEAAPDSLALSSFDEEVRYSKIVL